MKTKLLRIIIAEIIIVMLFSIKLLSRVDAVEGNYLAENQIEEKKVALTFDDGPDPVYTPMLLDGLSERNVKATFFVLGKQAELYPELVKQMQEEGHEIGNHTFHHVQLTTLSKSQVMEELNSTSELLYEITGEYPDLFRPPFGSIREEMEEEIDMLKVLWDIDPCDWYCCEEQTVVQRVMKDIEDGSIILMHDASKSSVEAALKIVDVLLQEGYTFVTADQLIYE